MIDVFLSYSRRNEEITQRIRKDLQNEGISVWIDQTGLKRGSPRWQTDIQNAIENAQSLVVVLSPAAKQSAWVGREVGYANNFDIPIYPVLAQGNERTAVPINLVNTDWFDIRQRYSRGIAELIKALRQLLGMSDTKEIPTTSNLFIKKQKIEEIINVMGGSFSSGVVEIGRVTLSFGLNAYQKDTNIGYRATIYPITDTNALEAGRRIELRGWEIGPFGGGPHFGQPLRKIRLGRDRPKTYSKAYVYTWPRGDDQMKMRKQVVEEIVAVNELLGIWPEDIKVSLLT
ncbi:MAG: toll/interleukin-1 receptor domain-containing protein [Anaerolineales bacterium]|jgi:hypothetical protein